MPIEILNGYHLPHDHSALPWSSNIYSEVQVPSLHRPCYPGDISHTVTGPDSSQLLRPSGLSQTIASSLVLTKWQTSSHVCQCLELIMQAQHSTTALVAELQNYLWLSHLWRAAQFPMSC